VSDEKLEAGDGIDHYRNVLLDAKEKQYVEQN
jgi:putative ubiquitin-RnfH superfamily antitoxin RatB of RatAB toxin-antitoxin module